MCAAEMYVTQVVQDGTMPVPGFEHHTLECLECGEIERRLVFTREKTQPISPSLRRKKERVCVYEAISRSMPRSKCFAFHAEPAVQQQELLLPLVGLIGVPVGDSS
jgi:hypothetical protein